MRVYYFTESPFALSNIALRRMKISRFFDLNDPFELLGADLGDQEDRRLFSEIKEDLHKNRGLLCFSKSWDNPVLWSHYADKHRGICLGFDIPDERLTPVIYTKEPIKLAQDKRIHKTKPSKKIIKNLMRTKFVDWRYESEFRVFVQLDHETIESGLYFYPFSENLALREVILGPRCEIPADNVSEALAGFKPKAAVIKARVAFTKFKVIDASNN